MPPPVTELCPQTVTAQAPVVGVRASDLPLVTSVAPVAMAVIVGVDGPSYRPVGAALFVDAGGNVAGNLSSGCIDADVVLHAREVAVTGMGKKIRYGAGSPFMDLRLPCGGGLDILIMPVRDDAPLRALQTAMQARRSCDICLTLQGPTVQPTADTVLLLHVSPDPRFLVFGKGPEAVAFARMTGGAGYETVALATADAPLGAQALELCANADVQTAIVLFFHDHDNEPAILRAALQSRAFYIGAQGSRRTAARRLQVLRGLGFEEEQCLRVRGPIGVIPSTRDARTLAVSVLAEVLAEAVG